MDAAQHGASRCLVCLSQKPNSDDIGATDEKSNMQSTFVTFQQLGRLVKVAFSMVRLRRVHIKVV